MKKWIRNACLVLAVLLVIPATLAGCGQKSNTVKIGVVGSVGADLWKPVAKKLKHEGINLKIVTFTDYNQPNDALKQKEVDINSYQHTAFLNDWNKANHGDLVAIGKTTLLPMAIYSQKLKSIKDVKKGAKVTLPNDVTNEARALKLLATAGLIKLDSQSEPAVKDVTSNKLKLKLTPVDAAQVARTLPDVQLAVINSNYAVDAKLKLSQALYQEHFSKISAPYINVVATNKDQKNNKTYQKVVKAFQTSANAKLIKDTYHGAILPAWNVTLK